MSKFIMEELNQIWPATVLMCFENSLSFQLLNFNSPARNDIRGGAGRWLELGRMNPGIRRQEDKRTYICLFLYLILKCSALFVMLPTVTSPSDKPLDFGISKLCARIKPSILSPFHFAYFKGTKKVLKL